VNDDVTVVITCFNYGRFIDEAVRSALAQEGGAPHVIVVDDGSTEAHTEEALSRLPEEVDVIRQANRGAAAARNAGLARATTPFLLVLDGDDRLMPWALSAMRHPLLRDDRVGYSYGYLRFFGAREGDIRFPPYDPYRLLYRHIVGVSALMRRQVFLDTGGFDPEFRHYEDWEIWVHAFACGWRGVQVPETTVEYRRHGSSKFSRATYRTYFGKLRSKHRSLYESGSAAERDSELSALGRAAYRYFWGARPVPARVEQALYQFLWRARR
jgi:glycosyltransferase involved in cell wall biosynthesis